MGKHEVEDRDEHEQQREHRDEGGVGEVGDERPGVVVAELLHDAEDEGRGSEALLGRVDRRAILSIGFTAHRRSWLDTAAQHRAQRAVGRGSSSGGTRTPQGETATWPAQLGLRRLRGPQAGSRPDAGWRACVVASALRPIDGTMKAAAKATAPRIAATSKARA